MKNNTKISIVILVLLSSLFSQNLPKEFFLYRDSKIPVYFNSKLALGYIPYNPVTIQYADTSVILYYSRANYWPKQEFFDIGQNLFITLPKEINYFIMNMFFYNGKPHRICIDRKKIPFLDEKYKMIPDDVPELVIDRFGSGIKSARFNPETGKLDYLVRDEKDVVYHIQMDIHDKIPILYCKLITKNYTDSELEYLYYFDKDSLVFFGDTHYSKFHTAFFIEEGYRLVSTNSYPIIFDRDNNELIIILNPTLKVPLKLKKYDFTEGNPVSAYSTYTDLYVLIRENKAVRQVKYSYEINLLRIKRNAIYAKYGRKFKNKPLQEIFNQQPWYKPNPDYSDTILTEDDKKELNRLIELEKINKLFP